MVFYLLVRDREREREVFWVKFVVGILFIGYREREVVLKFEKKGKGWIWWL